MNATPSSPAASARTRGSSGPSPMSTALTSRRPCSRRRRIARTRCTAPCQRRNAPAKTASTSPARSLERERAGGVGPEPIRVGAPLDFEDASGVDPGRQDGARRRHDEVGLAALPVAPAPHRLDQQQAVETPFRRSGVVDDRRVHLEHRERLPTARGQHAFAAEVVVPLHDDVGCDAIGRAPARRARAGGAGAAGPPAAAPRARSPACRRRETRSRPAWRRRARRVRARSTLRPPRARGSTRRSCPAPSGRCATYRMRIINWRFALVGLLWIADCSIRLQWIGELGLGGIGELNPETLGTQREWRPQSPFQS